MNLIYKKADVSDIDVLTQTRIHVLRTVNALDETTDMSVVEEKSYAYYKESFQADSHVAYLVFDGDVIAGTGGISFYEVMPTYHNPTGKKAYIMNMYTHPDYRRNGIATKMLDLLVGEATKRGISFISLEATDMGKALYIKYGFVSMQDEMLLQVK